MQQGPTTRQADYATVTLQLAIKALSIATDTAPHRARQGERRWALANALPAARVLIEQASGEDRAALPVAAQSLAETLADPTGKVTDGFGHTRPSYTLIAIHLLGLSLIHI